jgi:aminodeoxyfutalosine synthase
VRTGSEDLLGTASADYSANYDCSLMSALAIDLGAAPVTPPLRPREFDPATVRAPALRRVAEKYARGERLDGADALTMYHTSDLLGLGRLADHANRVKHGDVVTFAANQHLNPTNVCILRKTCVFCSFARLPKEEGAYHYTMDEVWEEAKAAANGLTREFHIVGGLDMKAGLAYYSEIFRGLKERYPHVHIKALTAVEIAHIARIEKMSVRDVLIALREAGLDTLPGGGAEVFGKAVRATIADRKLAAEDWIAVHRAAHELGIRSNCTMLYGHVETLEDRVEHLQMLRDLQDETGGFLAYIPLAYHPDHNELGRELGREGTATTGFDDLRNLAVGRLFLDSIPHVKTHWVMVTPLLSQTSLAFGVNDVEGTVVREKVYHEAGARTSEHLALAEILSLIRGAGKIPAERDSLYNVLRVFDGADG